MEYNPVAINEAMAYSFAISSGSGESNRFFVELVNTLSQSALGLLPAGDFGAGITNPPDVSILDLSLANYDLVMTADDPVSRPDPFTGQLLPISSAKYYAQLPLNQANSAATNPLFIPALTVPASGDVQLTPLYSVGAPNNPPAAADFPTSPTRYFFVIGSPLASGTETAPINATANLSPAYDPLSPTAPPATPPSNVVPPGYCLNLQSVPVAPQPVTTKSNTMPPKITPLAVGSGTMQYYWLCLRRPANPFAPPQADISLSTYNPMVVVDAMRFPYTEGGVTPPPPLLRALCLLMPRRSSQASAASRSGAVTPFVYPATPRPPRLRSTPLTATASKWPPLSPRALLDNTAGTRSPRPCTTRWAPSTISPSHGITSRSTTATSRAWPS